MTPQQIILRPVVTEKTTDLAALDQYVFEVASGANKIQIRGAVEMAFGVRVQQVRTMLVRPSKRRVGKFRGLTKGWKKAIVKLRSGDSIDLYGGQ
ncbi:MAG: 50S ribosomal protein L23 [Nannocystaceae bacterium]